MQEIGLTGSQISISPNLLRHFKSRGRARITICIAIFK